MTTCDRIEPLESRRLLTATLGGDGTLSVVGTDSADVISIAPNSFIEQIDVFDGVDQFAFNAGLVTAIFISARGGDDSVKISNGLSQPATILGGAGRDTLLGGGGRDSIDGEGGNDFVDGGKKPDTLVGGDGDDRIVAASITDGSDRFSGGAGNDTIDYSRRSSPIVVTGGRLEINAKDELDTADDVVETLIGTAGNDDIRVDREDSSGDGILRALFGGRGDDILTLTPLGVSVSIFGGDGNDRLSDAVFTDLPQEVHFFGDAGNDLLRVSPYPSIRIMHGGAGIDTADFSFAVGGAYISLDNVANDFVPSRFLPDPLIGNVFDDVENLIGTGNGPNTFVGSDKDNIFTLHGRAGNSISALGGNDVIIGNRSAQSESNDTIDGGGGIDACEEDSNDQITGIESTFANGEGTGSSARTRAKPPAAGSSLNARGKLSVFGSVGDDFIRITQTSAGISVFISGLEARTYFPASSVKTISINAQAGDDEVVMFKSNGTGRVTRQTAIFGSDGDDVIFAGDAGSQLVGGRGNDSLVGGNGRDFLDGGDQFAAQSSTNDSDDGIDTLVGGAGDDFVSLQSRVAGTIIRLRGSKFGNAAEDIIHGIENVFSGRGDDAIFGDVANNIISGGIGSDTIRGGAGLDQILPNSGTDTVFVDDDTSFDFVKLSDDLLADTCFTRDEDFVSTDGEDVINPQ